MLAIPILPFSYSLDPGIPPSVGYRASVGYRGLSHGLLDNTGLGHGVASPGCRAAQLAKLLRYTCSARPASRAISMGFPTVAFPCVLHLIYLVPLRCCRGEGQVIGSCALGAMHTSRCQDHLSLGVPSARARVPVAWQWSRIRYSGYSYSSHAFLISTSLSICGWWG